MPTLTDSTAVDLSLFETTETAREPLEGIIGGENSTKGSEALGIPQTEPLAQFHDMPPEITYDPANVKLISRKVAELTPDIEYKNFLEVKKTLMVKKYSEGLSKKEELTLQLTLWNIDRIEDAKYGRHLDALEAIVKANEMVAEKIRQTLDNLNQSITDRSGRGQR